MCFSTFFTFSFSFFFPLILTALNNSVLAFPGKRAHFIVFHISGRQSTALKHATGYANDWIAWHYVPVRAYLLEWDWNGENGSDDGDSIEWLCGQVETKCAAFLNGLQNTMNFWGMKIW